MNSDNKRKLKNYFVDRDLQIRVVAYGMIYMTAVVLITVAVILFPIAREMDWADNLEVRYYAAQTFLFLTTKIIPAAAVIILLYILHLIAITHRICGPLVNFTHAFRRVGEGDLRQRLHIRQGDYLKKECGRINDMIRELSLMITEAKRIQQLLAGDAARLAALAGDKAAAAEISGAVSLLEQEVRDMGRTLSHFKTGNEAEPTSP